MNLSTIHKAKILCAITVEAESDDGNLFETFWKGMVGYAPPDEQAIDVEDRKEWEDRINEEWDDFDFDDDIVETEARRHLSHSELKEIGL